jgi:general secretion pathway protein K
VRRGTQQTRPAPRTPRAQRGAALLQAMLTVALVATFAAGAAWQQWRGIEVESAERQRQQATWVLSGALDWARLILREDARSGGADHLAEPWAIPLQEARLSTFLAAEQGVATTGGDLDLPDVFLSGQITDLQSRLNLANLASTRDDAEPAVGEFARLFERLGLPPEELATLTAGLRAASGVSSSGGAGSGAINPATAAGNAPLMPSRIEQLTWLGLSGPTLRALAPHVTLLPATTPLNLNTASAEVIHAAAPAVSLADAQRLVAERDRAHLRTLADAAERLGLRDNPFPDTRFAVASRFFEVRGRLRSDGTVVEERSLVRRDSLDVRVVWRERVAQPG